jgi:hypothetical protein
MANIAGIDGGITLPSGYNILVNNWSANYTVETVDSTTFDSSGFREFEPTIQSMTGAFGGHGQFDATTTAPIPAALVDGGVLATGDLASTKATVTLTATTGCTLAGTAIITGLSFSRDVAGKLEITGELQFSGPITQTWDEVA